MRSSLIGSLLPFALGALLLIIVLPSGARGGWFSEARVTDSGTPRLAHRNGRPVASGPDGRIHLVWRDDRGGHSEIYYRSFDGAGWAAETRLTDGLGGSLGPCVAVGPDNRLHIGWYGTRDGDLEIYYKVGDGDTWGADQRLTHAEEMSANPSLGVDEAGRVYVVWHDTRDGNYEVYFKRFDGVNWGEDERLTFDEGDSYYPMLAVSPTGQVHVVWRDNRDGNKEIYYKHFDGSAWSEDLRLTFDSAVSQEASVCLDTEGSPHVVWSDWRDGNREIYYKRFDGTDWQADLRLTFAENASTMPSVAADDSGHLHVIWIDVRDGAAEIYYKARRGEVWSEDRRLTEGAKGCTKPSICPDRGGNLHVVWQDNKHGRQSVYWKERFNGSLEKPGLCSVTPAVSNTGEAVPVRLTGSGFVYPDSVWLARPGLSRLIVSDVVTESDSVLTCGLSLEDSEVGLWSVVVKNADGQKDTLIDGFGVLPGLVWDDECRLTYSAAPSKTGESGCIAVDQEGDLHVVWHDMRDGKREIYYKRREGANWGLDKRLTQSGGGMRCPSVVADQAGNVHVVWQATDAGGYEVHYRRFDESGWGEARRLNNDPGFSLYPSMTVDGLGHVHVVWSDNYSGDFQILHRVWDGISWSKKEQVTDTRGASLYPSIAAGEDGNLHLVWQNDRSGIHQVYHKMFNGLRWGADERVSENSSPATEPALAVGPDGTVHVAWNDFRGTHSVYSSIYYRSKGPAGWSGEQKTSGTYYQAGRPTITVDPLGTIHLVWQFDYYDESGIAWTRGSSNTWEREVIVPTKTDLAMLPSVTTDESGTVHLVYCSDAHGQPEIYYRSWSRETLAAPVIVSITPAEVYNSSPVRTMIWGTGFQAAPKVRLENEFGETLLAQAIERKSPRLVECEFDLVAVTAGSWDLCIENRDRQGDRLVNAIMVLQGPWSLPEQISSGSTSGRTASNNARCVAREPNGAIHAVWRDSRDGNYEIYYRQGLGAVWGTETRLTECDGSSGSPSIVIGDNHAMHLCWDDHRSGTIEVYYKKFHGTFWGPERLISPEDSIRSENPAMAVDAGGNPFIFYQDKRYGALQVICSRWDGTDWIEERITDQPEAAYSATCASDGAGCVHVFWESKTGGGREVYHRAWDGTGWGAVSRIAGSWAVAPTCACDGAGKVMVVWYQSWSNKLAGAIRHDGEWHELTEIPGLGASPNLASDGLGQFHLAYDYCGAIYYQSYGGSWSAPARLNRGSDGSRPFVSCDGGGHPVVIWMAGRDEDTRVMASHWEGDPGVTGIDAEHADPRRFGIVRASPNPFRAGTEIGFALPSASNASIAVFDVRGALVWQAELTGLDPGVHSVTWGGEDTRGRRVSPGIYFVRLAAAGRVAHTKVVLIR